MRGRCEGWLRREGDEGSGWDEDLEGGDGPNCGNGSSERKSRDETSERRRRDPPAGLQGTFPARRLENKRVRESDAFPSVSLPSKPRETNGLDIASIPSKSFAKCNAKGRRGEIANGKRTLGIAYTKLPSALAAPVLSAGVRVVRNSSVEVASAVRRRCSVVCGARGSGSDRVVVCEEASGVVPVGGAEGGAEDTVGAEDASGVEDAWRVGIGGRLGEECFEGLRGRDFWMFFGDGGKKSLAAILTFDSSSAI